MVENNVLPPIEAFILELHKANIVLWVDGNQLRSKAPTGAITETVRSQIKARKDELIAFLSQAKRSQMALTTIQPVERTALTTIPLSFSQENLWLLEQIERGNTAYNEIDALQFTGALEVTAFQRALCEIVERHESLRTTFKVNERGEPMQVINPPNFTLPLIDLSHLTEEQQREMIQRLAQEEASSPFDLEKGPLFRCKLLCLQAGNQQMINQQERHSNQPLSAVHILLTAMHHLIGDVWSFGILMQELAALYAAFVVGKPSPLLTPLIQYADYAIWQRTQEGGERMAEALAYWKNALANAPALLQLPTDHPRPAVQRFCGKHVRFTLANELIQPLRALSQAQDATLFMVLFAAFNILLARYSHQEEIMVGIPIANRQQREVEGLIGFLINTLALRTRVNIEQNFLELLTQVRQTTQEAYDYQDLSFANVVSAVQPERNRSYSPLFQVVFAMQNIPTLRHMSISGLEMSKVELELGISKYDLTIQLYEVTDGLSGFLEYNTDLFDESTIERMASHYQVLLQGIVDNPSQPIATLPLLTTAERQQILVEWNDTATDYPKDQCIHQLFEAQAARTPDAVAVLFDSGEQKRVAAGTIQNGRPPSSNHPITQSLTYGELNARANQLAHALQALGVRAGDLVGLCLERTPDLVVAVLAILKAGGGYVPFDPTYPTERLAYILANADIRLLITTLALQPQLAWMQGTPCFTDWATLDSQPTTNPITSVTPESVLFCLYTSGSTGNPKGVLMPHRAIVNLIEWQLEYTTVRKQARTLQFSPINFDVSCQEIFATLCAGGTLVLIDEQTRREPDALLRHLEIYAVERLYLPFVALQQMAEMANGRMPTFLREVNTAGEQLVVTPALSKWFLGAACSLQNHYGPTETHVVTALKLPANVATWPTLPSIGRPIANVQLYILNQAGQPMPIGVPGELYISGAVLSHGYRHRPELTAERFITNPFGVGKLYKTGDLARWRPDGNVEFLGRIDNQVKLRGFRIELGEIEATLTEHPAIQEAVVVTHEVIPGDKRLVAYITSDQTTSFQDAKKDSLDDASPSPIHPLASSTLRHYLHSKLPSYMIPSAFVLLNALPLTPNGKVDRKALPAPVLQSLSSKDFVPPQTETEVLVAAIWMEVLGLPQIGIHDTSLILVGIHSWPRR
ncbi:MAG: amino acid adenylation domain-containing protein [Caldilineaceae bacterium]